jgi:hypothetical protein
MLAPGAQSELREAHPGHRRAVRNDAKSLLRALSARQIANSDCATSAVFCTKLAAYGLTAFGAFV